MFLRYSLCCAAVLAASGLAQAQSSRPGNSWLMQNYHFTGPPAPRATPVTDPRADLEEVQRTVLAILRKSNYAWDFEAALAASYQAAANTQLKAAFAEARQAPQNPPTPSAAAAIYLVALKDQSIHAATAYWVDGVMLHFITSQGAHEQVRLDLVDRDFSVELNRERNVEFRLPPPK
jgi:hypothetical protein